MLMPKPKVGTGSSGIFQCSTHRLGKITPFSSRFTVYLIFDNIIICLTLFEDVYYFQYCTEVRTLIIEHDC